MAEKALTSRQKQIREKLAKEMNRKQEQHRIDMLRRRIELAKSGLAAYEAKRFPEAVTSFMNYLKILEDWKKVESGGLSTAHFDGQRDAAEMLLISTIYWNLTKLFDRAGKGRPEQEFRHALQQFLIFSKGKSYTPLCSEPLRKYLESGNAVHRSELRSVYKQISGTKCFVATSLLDVTDTDTIVRLQIFRDAKLNSSWLGRRFIGFYYALGPWAAIIIDITPQVFRRVLGDALSKISYRLDT